MNKINALLNAIDKLAEVEISLYQETQYYPFNSFNKISNIMIASKPPMLSYLWFLIRKKRVDTTNKIKNLSYGWSSEIKHKLVSR